MSSFEHWRGDVHARALRLMNVQQGCTCRLRGIKNPGAGGSASGAVHPQFGLGTAELSKERCIADRVPQAPRLKHLPVWDERTAETALTFISFWINFAGEVASSSLDALCRDQPQHNAVLPSPNPYRGLTPVQFCGDLARSPSRLCHGDQPLVLFRRPLLQQGVGGFHVKSGLM